jgi:hypothetical protein
VQQQVPQIKGSTATATASATATIDRQRLAGGALIADSKGGKEEEREMEKEEPYVSYVRAPALWPDCHSALSEGQWDALLGGTAERLYGSFE